MRPNPLDGYITCLRQGCNSGMIPLDSSGDADAKDGGITRGFGAFTAYQVPPPLKKIRIPVF